MHVLNEIPDQVRNINNYESLTASLVKDFHSQKMELSFPKYYYYLTHLVNPALTFWSKKRGDVPRSDETARKLSLGKRLERLASFWFKGIPNFLTEEGVLDGQITGVPGVRGKFDFKIGDSLIEFKTKENLPSGIDQVYSEYPQDIEQLAFYSAIHPLTPKINYLVFMNVIPPYKFMAFKLTLNNPAKIKELMNHRVALLKKAESSDTCSELGRCRYYNNGCQYSENNICKCDTLEQLSLKVLYASIKLQYDAEFTALLQNEKEKSTIPKDLYTTKDIIAPRKYLMEKKLNIEEAWRSNTKRESYLACMSKLILKMKFSLSNSEIENIKSSLLEKRLYSAHRWLKIKTSIKPNGEILPYLVKYSTVKDIDFTKKPNRYFLTELGIICGAYGILKGLIFVVYPYVDDLLRVFEVVYKDDRILTNIVIKHCDTLNKTFESGEILSVDPCPKFMNNEGSCPLMDICHSKDNIGCDPDYTPKKDSNG